MSWRSIFISKPAKLSLRDNALFIKQECEISVPLEDIAVVVIDCREVGHSTDEYSGVLVHICTNLELHYAWSFRCKTSSEHIHTVELSYASNAVNFSNEL